MKDQANLAVEAGSIYQGLERHSSFAVRWSCSNKAVQGSYAQTTERGFLRDSCEQVLCRKPCTCVSYRFKFQIGALADKRNCTTFHNPFFSRQNCVVCEVKKKDGGSTSPTHKILNLREQKPG